MLDLKVAARQLHICPHIDVKLGKGDDDFGHECAIIECTVGDKHLRYIAVGLGYSPKRRLQNWVDLFVLLDEVIVTRNK